MKKAKFLALFLIAVFIVAGESFASSKIKMTTYAEGSTLLKPDEKDTWHLGETIASNPRLFFELKMDIIPLDGFTLWYKASALSVPDNRNEPTEFAFYDLNLKYNKNLGGGQGFEVISYMREDSRFWIDQPLLRFTDNGGSWGLGDSRGDSGSLNGVYFNGWNILGLNMLRAFIVSPGHFGENEKKLSGALRVRKDFLNGGLKVGATYVYYREAVPGEDAKSWKVGALDFDTNLLGPFQLVFETATCAAPTNQISEGDNAQWTYKGELRGSFSLGDFGQTGFLFSLYYVTEKFQNWRGNGSDGATANRFVERLEWFYNFPLKAISLKEVIFYSHPVAGWSRDNFHLWNYSFNGTTEALLESYTELYVEFKYGFKFKSYFKQTEGAEYKSEEAGVWRSLFFQLEMENAFARIKPQALFLNINRADARASVFGAEVLINLSDQIKFFSRFAMVSGSEGNYYRSEEKERNWFTFACELQFLRLFSNTEMFLSFGDFGHTNDDLVHDKNGGIINGRNFKAGRQLKLFVKFWM